MRTASPLVLALALAACGRSDRASSPASRETASGASLAASASGGDAFVLRVARRGGTVRVAAYPAVDSVVWRSSDAAPAIDHVIGFDDDAGALSFVDARGDVGQIDLHLGTVSVTRKPKLHDVTSQNGSTLYGVGDNGSVVRLTPAGEWTFKPPRPARAVLPQRNGTVLVLAGRGNDATLWQLRPPETRLRDTLALPSIRRTLFTQVGDRAYFVTDHGIRGVRASKQLDLLPEIRLDQPVRSMAATPSGDRLFVTTESEPSVHVIDRYRDEVARTIDLPGQPAELRMDPLGRYLLVQMAKHDSAWVIALGTDRTVGAVATAWRADLPAVAPDGAIALVEQRDVVLVDGETLRSRKRVAGGADDVWYPFSWTGLRPRAASLDQPVRFPGDDSASADSARAHGDSASTAARSDTLRPAPAPAPAPSPSPGAAGAARGGGFFVQFAAVLSEQRAKETAAQIHVSGESPRVVASSRDGTTIYRVVLGPYPTRDEAVRVGRDSRQSYWVYEGTP